MTTREVPLTFDYGTERVGTCLYDDETGTVTMKVTDPDVQRMIGGTGDDGLTIGMSILRPPLPPVQPFPRVTVKPRQAEADAPYLGTVQFGGSLSNEEIHLEASNEMGATLCGIELFPRDDAGHLIPRGWSRGGGDTGPTCRRVPCPGCRDVAHARFPSVEIVDGTFNLDWSKP